MVASRAARIDAEYKRKSGKTASLKLPVADSAHSRQARAAAKPSWRNRRFRRPGTGDGEKARKVKLPRAEVPRRVEGRDRKRTTQILIDKLSEAMK